MTLPSGATSISSINTTNYTYLTNTGQVKTSWSSAKSDFVGKGKPLYNLERDQIKLEDIELINVNLPESQKNFVFTNNSIFEQENVTSDLMFTSTPSQEYSVQVTFIDEGAGYKNSLGYYFYVLDGSGNPVILDNHPSTNGNGSLGHYQPTIIFPNASSIAGGHLRSDGVLLPGHKRTLKGNLPNGKFKNVNVGFFLVPNGYDNRLVTSSSSVGVRYDNKPILHTQSSLNPNHVENAVGVDNNGYQSVLFKYNNGDNYVIGFEDIQRPSGDGDFNDLIIRVTTNPAINLADTVLITPPTIDSSILQKTKLGLLFIADEATMGAHLGEEGYSYCLRRRLNFDSEFNRNRYLQIYEGSYLLFNCTVTYSSEGAQSVFINYEFTSLSAYENIVNGKVQFYLLETESNRDDELVLDPTNPDVNERTRFDKLVLLQRLENDNVLSEDYTLKELGPEDHEEVKTSETNTVPHNTTRSALIWGDPHIQKIDGSVVTVLDTGRHTYLETDKIKIEVNFDFYRDHPVKVYRDYTFIKDVYLTDVKTGAVLHLDMFDINLPVKADDLSVYQVLDISEVAQTKSLRPKLLSLTSFDPNVNVKVVCWKNNTYIWIIFYPTRTDFFNEIYISKEDLNKIYTPNWKGLIV